MFISTKITSTHEGNNYALKELEILVNNFLYVLFAETFGTCVLHYGET